MGQLLMEGVDSRKSRYYSLHIWRGAACLLVVIYHSVLLSHLETSDELAWLLTAGVPAFFVISGYCISATVDSTSRRPRPVANYVRRRIRRIYPPYWIALALIIPIAIYYDTSERGWIWFRGISVWQFIGNATLTETWRFHVVGGGGRGLILNPAWTLCYEEQFYAVAGVMMLLGMRSYFRSAMVVSVATLGICVAANRWGWQINGFFFDGFWLLFAAGILVYFAVNYATAAQRRIIQAGSALAVSGGVVAAQLGWLTSIPRPFATGFVFAVILLWIHRWDRQIFSARLLQPVRFCGKICYSMYLIHVLTVMGTAHAMRRVVGTTSASFVLLTLPITVAVTVSAAWIFHLVAERRFMNSTPRAMVAPVVGLPVGDQEPNSRPTLLTE